MITARRLAHHRLAEPSTDLRSTTLLLRQDVRVSMLTAREHSLLH